LRYANIRIFGLVVLIAISTVMATVRDTGSTENSQPLLSFLVDKLGLSDKEIKSLVGGEVIVKVPGVDNDRELILGAIGRVDVPEEFVLQQIHDYAGLRKHDGVVQIERLSSPPLREEFDKFVLPKILSAKSVVPNATLDKFASLKSTPTAIQSFI